MKSHKKRNIEQYQDEDYRVAYAFAKEIYKELGSLVRAIVLFGSAARKTTHIAPTGDVDVLVILEDVSVELSPELIQTYRIIIQKIIARVSQKLHITTLRFTNFWEYVRNGDPIAVNILRDGVALIDTGFFDPLQMLLYQGRIRPSAESIYVYWNRAPLTLQRAKGHILQAVLDLYWAVIDAAHAALMRLGEVPPSPHHVGDLLEEKMVKTGLIHKKYASVMREFYELSKMITHNQLTEISGDQFDLYLREAEDFVKTMHDFVDEKK